MSADHIATVREALEWASARVITGTPDYARFREAKARLDALAAELEAIRAWGKEAHDALIALAQQRDALAADLEQADRLTEQLRRERAEARERMHAAEARVEQLEAAHKQVCARVAEYQTADRYRDGLTHVGRIACAALAPNSGGEDG